MNSDPKKLSFSQKIHHLVASLRPSEKMVFSILVLIFAVSGFYALEILNLSNSVDIPARGGTYHEGMVGYARFINPLLSYTDADKDMSALIYSGLLKPTPAGKLEGDLASDWNISVDGLTYIITLKAGATFHDGVPVTADDVIYTIQKAVDPAIKSPKADSWAGVSVAKIDDATISFTLKKPYAPFLENLTLGILPKHIWQEVSDDTFSVSIYNQEPIGSGPYKIQKAYKDNAGIYEYYDLVPFPKYTLGAPYISHFITRFYKSEEDALAAYKSGNIDGLGGIAPEAATVLKNSDSYLVSSPLPRVFSLFFNQSQAPIFVHKEVRQALDVSVNRDELISKVLQGWGGNAFSPIPAGLSNSFNLVASSTASTTNIVNRSGITLANNSAAVTSASSNDDSNSFATTTVEIDPYIAAGQKILAANGWKKGGSGFLEKKSTSGKTSSTEILKFTISTSDVPELKETANILKDTWFKLGADVSIKIYDPSDLTQKVIRPRQYGALLFGQVIGRDLDLYPFWHSSQRNDPGLNIALYTNIKADKDLEVARSTSDDAQRTEAYRAFETEIRNDIPAVFLYSPDYIYAENRNVQNIQLFNMTAPAERFMSVNQWYVESDRVWKIFTDTK